MAPRPAEPPRLARRLLEESLEWEVCGPVMGDLHEVWLEQVAAHGRRRAGLWYWWQALTFSTGFVLERLRHDDGRWDMRTALEGLVRDLGHGIRNLRKTPGFTVVAVGTLALAIGANTAIFSVIDKVLLEPLPFDDPGALVTLAGTAPGSDLPDEFGLGTEFYVQYREQSNRLADLALVQGGQGTVAAGENVDRLFGAAVSPSLYTVLGVEPVIGRVPTEADPEATVGVLSHWLWLEWFGGDPNVLGQPITAMGTEVTIVGVMGPDFQFPSEQTSIWVHDLPTEPVQAGGFGLGLVGRMAPDVTPELLAEELSVLTARLPERFGGNARYQDIIDRFRPIIRPLDETLVGDIRGPLWILLGTVGLVLLIACANVANLLLVRAESRRLDLAVRRALGAGRLRLVRAQLSEAAVLAAAGGIGGVVLAWFGVPLLVRAAPESIPRLSSVTIDGSALFFTGFVALVAALLAGLLPALRFSNPEFAGGLRGTERAGGGPDRWVRDGLVVLQTATALVLLVGSGLLLQSFQTLTNVDPGYETADIFTFQAAPDPQANGLVDAPTFARFHYEFMDRLRALPGVESVGLVNTLPLDEGAGTTLVMGESEVGEELPQPTIGFTMAGGDYFETMGIDLLSGRLPEQDDRVPAEVEGVISVAAAERVWPGEDPLGRRVFVAPDGPNFPVRIVGVVEDIYLSDFRQEQADPMLYLPMVGPAPTAWAVGTPAYVVKTPRAGSIAGEIREVVRDMAPEAPMYRVFTMEALAGRSMARLSFTMLTIVVAAVLALVLGAVGLFGVLSYVVSQRTREIGIRMALGAKRSHLRTMIVLEGGRVTVVGVAVGLLAAVGATRVLATLLYGVEPIHIPTFVGMSLVMLGVALVASYVPAHRASSVDPMRVVREE